MPFTSILKTIKKKFSKKNAVLPVQPAGLHCAKRLSGRHVEIVNVVGMALAFEMGRTKGSAARKSIEADKASESNKSILALADAMADAFAVPASDSWTDEAAFDDSCILGVDSDDDPIVEGQGEKQVLALMGFGKPAHKAALAVEILESSVDSAAVKNAAPIESSDSGTSILALSAALGNMFALPTSDSWASDATFDESFGVDGDEQAAAPSDEMLLTVMGLKYGHDLRLAEGVEGAHHAAIQHATRTNVSPRAAVPLQRLSGNMGPPHPVVVERWAHSEPTGAGVETRSGLAVQDGARACQRKEYGQPSRIHASAQPFVGTFRSALHDANGRTINNTLRRSKAVVSRRAGKENAACPERP
ncbi:hypothetical protein HWV62_7654 [Athelia sp. TMB]|nr:hypothetical protein HWV62_7654 [Athelia sp. TMB]